MILYGHAESNAAWPALLADGPMQVQRGSVRIGLRELPATTWPVFSVRPRPDSQQALVAVVSGTGLIGPRLTERLPYFLSGVAYPDCSVFSSHGSEAKMTCSWSPVFLWHRLGRRFWRVCLEGLTTGSTGTLDPRVLTNGPGFGVPASV